MNRTQFLTILLMCVNILLLIGCRATQTPAPTEAHALPTDTPLPAVVTTIRQKAADLLGTSPEEVEIVFIETATWEDTCLGLPLAQDTCQPQSLAGYHGFVQYGEERLEFRAEERGGYVYVIPSAVELAREQMAKEFHLELSSIKIVSWERHTWTDACLGVSLSAQECASASIEGYRIAYAYNGEAYIYHSDVQGATILLAEAPTQETAAYLEWNLEEAELCSWARIAAQTIEWSSCTPEEKQRTGLDEAQAADFQEFTSLFLPFQSLTQAGKIDFFGTGAVTATPFQQRMIAEWARWVFSTASKGDVHEEESLVLSWQYENSHGECYRVSVYAFGEARLSTCASSEPEIVGRLRLLSSQLQLLYAFQSQLHSFQHEVTNLGAQETSTTRLNFFGQGEEAATDYHKDWMIDLAESSRQQITSEAHPEEIEAARGTLLTYLNALAQARYEEAAHLFGGDLTILRQNNPNIPKDDQPALFQAGCTINGYRCNLLPYNEVYARQIAPDRFLFVYELQTLEGELFSLGPCCGADIEAEPPQTQFEFIVIKINDTFLVETLPVYVP